MKYLVFSVFLIASTFPSYAQKENRINGVRDYDYDYGKTPQGDIDMKVYPLDSSAEAVILTMKGLTAINVNSQGYPTLTFKYFKRIKLFKKSSFEFFGKILIPYSSKGNNFKSIKAASIQSDGTRQEFTSKNFIEEKTTEFRKTKKFTFPNLVEGCIIEYEYEFEVNSFVFPKLPNWLFQDIIPVRHTELCLYIPEKYEYGLVKKGQRTISNIINPRGFYNGSKVIESRYFADSVPPLKQESFFTTINDYLAQTDFYLFTINYPNGTSVDQSKNWSDIAESYLGSEYFGKQFYEKDNYSDIWKEVNPLLINAKTDDEKIKIIYDFLCTNVKWEENNFSAFSKESLNKTFKKKKANSGQLNLMMIACLREAGITASPLLVSSRKNGKPITNYPIDDQFDHLSCYVTQGDKPVIIDVGSIFRPVGIPRLETLNQFGWLLENIYVRWISINPPLSTKSIIANFKIDSIGSLSGSISGGYRGYSAVIERENESDTHEKIKKELVTNYPDIKVDGISTENLNNLSETFKRKIFCEIPNMATIANDIMYIKPSIKTDFDENPFKLPKREYPIEFPYPFKDQYVINLTIPKGYVVDEMPKSIINNLLINASSFQYISSVIGSVIQLVVKIQINQLVYQPEDYSIVKDFFNQVANKLAEQIVLKKINH